MTALLKKEIPLDPDMENAQGAHASLCEGSAAFSSNKKIGTGSETLQAV